MMEDILSDPRTARQWIQEPIRLQSTIIFAPDSPLPISESPPTCLHVEASPELTGMPEPPPAHHPSPISPHNSSFTDNINTTIPSPISPQVLINPISSSKRPWWKPRRLKGPLPPGMTREWPYETKQKMYANAGFFFGLGLGVSFGGVTSVFLGPLLGVTIGAFTSAFMAIKKPVEDDALGETDEEINRIEKEEILGNGAEDNETWKNKVVEVFEMKEISRVDS
jgi:hypothetical protein